LSFSSILIANRGEIAVRIVRAAQGLGIRAIAVFSEADRGALWTRIADEAHCLGPAPARASYLAIDRIIEVARAARADAVHPGYGLLSENADFARAVAEAGLTFIGPRPETIAVMGDKVAARAAAVAAGLPVLPGSTFAVSDRDQAMAAAETIGWPVAVKASFGGGGRGMRIAERPEELAAALEQAQREAEAAFGRGEVFLEHFLARPRHVEVQILADRHGATIHLGDRDCSVQRRHQKLIEEAPAPNLSEALRNRILDAAIALCRSVGYESAGTVEFLVDAAGAEFYFLEMNTRLQVEHGVTELVTGIDIVEQQIAVAAGAPLGLAQDDVQLRGHAIQGRIAAEDPWAGFRPAAGPVAGLRLPVGPWLRLDFGIAEGDRIEPHYDSMFGKIQAWGETRDTARIRLAMGLRDFGLASVPTTAPYLRTILDQPDFACARHDTGSLERDWQPQADEAPARAEAPTAKPGGPAISERVVALSWGGRPLEVSVFGIESEEAMAAPGRRSDRLQKGGATGSAAAGPQVRAPMDAVVVAVAVTAGQRIARGDPLVVLEAMKMEMIVAAQHDGIVTQIAAVAGQTVKSGAVLAIVEAGGAL
jgi:acetyl-CoA/propionyl-CoA carboxylase biotin carboxyl carrier protein